MLEIPMPEIPYQNDPERGYWSLDGLEAPVHSMTSFPGMVQIAFDSQGRIVSVAIVADPRRMGIASSRSRAVLHSAIEREFAAELADLPEAPEPPGKEASDD
jgi:hypothetical protein